MPMALVFTLQPAVAAEVHRSLGRSAHAAVLDLLGLSDPALPGSLHELAAVRPLTVSNLMDRQGGSPQTRVVPSACYRLRVTLLDAQLEEIGERWLSRPPTYLALGEVAWRVRSITADAGSDAWAGRATYADLAAQAMRVPDNGVRQWRFEFATPVTFRRRGTCVPLPTPGLVFGSLLDKWNMLSEFPLPEDLRARLDEDLLVSDFDLCSAAIPTKNGIAQIGALGSCTYRARREIAAYQGALDLLARFAFYSGVGAATARGFGQVRLAVDGHAPHGQLVRDVTHRAIA